MSKIDYATIDPETKCGYCNCTVAQHVQQWVKEEGCTVREAIIESELFMCDWCFSNFNDDSGHEFVIATNN